MLEAIKEWLSNLLSDKTQPIEDISQKAQEITLEDFRQGANEQMQQVEEETAAKAEEIKERISNR